MNNNLVTIVALSVDTRHAVLYKEDGSTLTIAQGDARLPRIVQDSKFLLGEGKSAVVDITPVAIERSEFQDAEKGTRGVVKFFRVAKSFLKSLVNTESPEAVPEAVAHVSPLTIGVFPNQGTKEGSNEALPDQRTVESSAQEDRSGSSQSVDPATTSHCSQQDSPVQPLAGVGGSVQEEVTDADQAKPVDDPDTAAPAENATNRPQPPALTNDQKLDAARSRMQQLVGNSVGTHQPEFHLPLDEKTETIVAVHEKSGAIIPDAHKLARQLRSSQKLENYVGFQKFIERLAGIIDDRAHSVEDLMKFIEKGDLPIADDGCIVIFKRLNRGSNGVFTDVHSGNIRQKVGSYVFMKPGLVDPDRRQDCSNGLHVASLSYLNGFSGDVTVMAKVRPEDVFAVPEYAHTKMRVCGYHILVDLPENLRNLVNSGGSISSDPQGAILLANVLQGNHIGITQHVEVGGHMGTNVTYTTVANAASADELPALKLDTAQTLDMQEALEAKAPVAADIKATDLISAPAEKVIKNIMSNPQESSGEEADAAPKLSQGQKALALLTEVNKTEDPKARQAAASQLLELKKKARKSWKALGLPETVEVTLSAVLGGEAAPVQAVQVSKSKPVAVPKTGKTVQEKAEELIKEGLSNVEVAKKTGLSKDQVYRLKKKLQK